MGDITPTSHRKLLRCGPALQASGPVQPGPRARRGVAGDATGAAGAAGS